MKILAAITLLVCLVSLLTSCTDSKTSYALHWSKEIKEKIAIETNIPPDSTYVDSSSKSIAKVSTFKKGVLLKEVGIDPITKDTFWIRLMSSNQKFSWAKELCPLEKDFYVEVIGYGNSGKHHSLIGLHQFNYCDGKLMRRGFEYNGRVGVWEEYDRSGKLLKRTDYGNMDKVDSALHEIKYAIKY